MEHYVTLFDNLFLPQGLALHASMERYASPYVLWVLCVDDVTFTVLQKLNLQNVRLIALRDVETADLKRIKPDRSAAEYCWTLTPFAPYFVFRADSTTRRVTYVDADLWFRKNPSKIFRELEVSRKSVLITDHAYAPEYDQSGTSGQFCVQFMTFLREGESIRKWWAERCIEWCYARVEDQKFGDQKYLDDWPERFPDQVHVLTDKELALAPWNAMRFPYGNSVLWHFHALRLLKTTGARFSADIGPYPIPACAQKYVYEPYLEDMRAAIVSLAQNGYVVQRQKKISIRLKLRMLFKRRYGIRSF